MICIFSALIGLVGCRAQVPEGQLQSIEYTTTGTMAGYIYEGRAEQNPDGSFTLKSKKENYGPLYCKQISRADMDSLSQIIIDEKMYKYKERYLPKFEVLDGEGWHFQATFSDGTHISSHGSNAWPGGSGLSRIQGYLQKLIAGSDCIVEEKED